MAFKMTDTNRIITIYNLSSATNEFIGKGDGFIPANTGLPAYSTDIAPPKVKAGFVAVFDIQTNKWSQVEDHRGETVYDISTGRPTVIETLGSLPDNVVSVAPEGGYVKWDGTQWVHDAEAEKAFFQGQAAQEKANLLMIATSAIAPLQDAVDLDIATEDESKALLAWKKYRVMLNRINPEDAQNIIWPESPLPM
ncbi:tail fiber assembly protein [Citrobacter freundii]|uniref:tail fiber assembly protein n=1 Tax=Citrobacter freundii TaxID=546 RepID=UPI0023B1A48F|nr:tail fiber assembly protein [Citrobacter freundii]MDE8814534.1 tail fiber assembly protein [Citrobacter freundii]MDV2274975.1 tail fiber assembly protein [Citrobacter freundii]MEB0855166.1 tail fiber assembly protein [Citrobacter freundii]